MFENRKDAALQLARSLEKYRDMHPIILGILRGGLETAYYVSKHLKASLSFIIACKLPYPGHPEYAFGGMAEDGSVYYNNQADTDLTRTQMAWVEEQQRNEINLRKNIFRKVQAFPNIKDKIVIIVDDGIATGATIYSAIRMCERKSAAKIIVATPVCSEKTKKELLMEVDDVVVLETPFDFHAVSQVYRSFENLNDKQVLDLLKKWMDEMVKDNIPKHN